MYSNTECKCDVKMNNNKNNIIIWHSHSHIDSCNNIIYNKLINNNNRYTIQCTNTYFPLTYTHFGKHHVRAFGWLRDRFGGGGVNYIMYTRTILIRDNHCWKHIGHTGTVFPVSAVAHCFLFASTHTLYMS